MKQATLRVARVLALPLTMCLAGYGSTALAASACKGLGKSQCSASQSCAWVSGYARSDGVRVSSHCRAKSGAGKQSRGETGVKARATGRKADSPGKSTTDKGRSAKRSTKDERKSTRKASTSDERAVSTKKTSKRSAEKAKSSKRKTGKKSSKSTKSVKKESTRKKAARKGSASTRTGS